MNFPLPLGFDNTEWKICVIFDIVFARLIMLIDVVSVHSVWICKQMRNYLCCHLVSFICIVIFQFIILQTRCEHFNVLFMQCGFRICNWVRIIEEFRIFVFIVRDVNLLVRTFEIWKVIGCTM